MRDNLDRRASERILDALHGFQHYSQFKATYEKVRHTL